MKENKLIIDNQVKKIVVFVIIIIIIVIVQVSSRLIAA